MQYRGQQKVHWKQSKSQNKWNRDSQFDTARTWYVIKQKTKANTIWKPVTKTKTLNHENISAKLTENIPENSQNIDPSNSNRKTLDEAINKTTKKISIPSILIDNVKGKKWM